MRISLKLSFPGGIFINNVQRRKHVEQKSPRLQKVILSLNDEKLIFMTQKRVEKKADA